MKRKQTKIVATISDRHCSQKFIRELYENGVNVVRINTAHQTPETSLKVVEAIRAVSPKIGILIDTKGPEVRTRGIDEPIQVESGDQLRIYSQEAADEAADQGFATSYEGFVRDVPVGTRILIDDGSVALDVVDKSEAFLECRAGNNGAIGKNKSINVPGIHLQLDSLTPKDREYVRFAVEQDIDFIAHSFVRNKQDVQQIQEILDQYNSQIKIIAKIENQQGVDNLEDILEVVFGIMIARGDLGIEIPAHKVPLVQKKMIETCIRYHKPVITATQMLHSMIENPRPTRAEVSDIANAVFDGTDALMLSGETAYGKYPLEAVKTMVLVAREAEVEGPEIENPTFPAYTQNTRYYLSKAVAGATRELGVRAILADTETGRVARLLSSFRPRVPIYAHSPHRRVVRELSLSYGVISDYMDYQNSIDDLVTNSIQSLLERGLISLEDQVVILAGDPSQKESTTNFLEINQVAKCIKTKL